MVINNSSLWFSHTFMVSKLVSDRINNDKNKTTKHKLASLRKKPNLIGLIINILPHFYKVNMHLCPASDDFACPPGMPRGQCRL